MPGSLEEALHELHEDHKFLLEGGVFTGEFVDLWINYKKKTEADPSGSARIRPNSICTTIFKTLHAGICDVV